MIWGTALDPAVPMDAFVAVLQSCGFRTGAGTMSELVIMDHEASGHRLVYVPRTGRIQLRLDALTRPDERVAAAERMYELISQAARQGAARTQGTP